MNWKRCLTMVNIAIAVSLGILVGIAVFGYLSVRANLQFEGDEQLVCGRTAIYIVSSETYCVGASYSFAVVDDSDGLDVSGSVGAHLMLVTRKIGVEGDYIVIETTAKEVGAIEESLR